MSLRLPIFRVVIAIIVVIGIGSDALAQQPNTPASLAVVDGEAWLTRSRQMLMSAPSLNVKLEQTGQLTSGRFESTGTYRAGRFPKLRVETTTKLRGLTGTLLEVCDGQVLWTERRVDGLPVNPDDDDSNGTEITVTRRDIDLIRDALAASPQSPSHILAAELGVGGLPSLLAGLQWAFDFRTDSTDAEHLVLLGRWKPAVREQLKISGRSPRVPTEVEIVFSTDSPVPREISYLRTSEDQRVVIMSMKFIDPELGRAIDDTIFAYQLPADVEVTNRTVDVVKSVEAAGDAMTEPPNQVASEK